MTKQPASYFFFLSCRKANVTFRVWSRYCSLILRRPKDKTKEVKTIRYESTNVLMKGVGSRSNYVSSEKIRRERNARRARLLAIQAKVYYTSLKLRNWDVCRTVRLLSTRSLAALVSFGKPTTRDEREKEGGGRGESKRTRDGAVKNRE